MAFHASSQNLVPNPSFETYTACPTSNSSEVYLATPWIEVETTADFYACSSLDNSQIARTGNAYMGVSTYRPSWNTTYREYIGIYLTQTLTSGVEYYVEFWVRLSWGHCWASDGMGAYISQGQPVTVGTQKMLYVPAQIMNPIYNLQEEHDSWMKVCGTFISNGTEDFITIGSFRDDAQSTFAEVDNCAGGNGVHWSYYHIDDVLLTEYDSTITVDCGVPGVPPNPEDSTFVDCELFLPNVISPNDDGINDQVDLSGITFEDFTFLVYNRWGTKIYETNEQLNQYWDAIDFLNPVNDGVYFYVFYSYDGNCYQTGSITVLK